MRVFDCICLSHIFPRDSRVATQISDKELRRDSETMEERVMEERKRNWESMQNRTG